MKSGDVLAQYQGREGRQREEETWAWGIGAKLMYTGSIPALSLVQADW